MRPRSPALPVVALVAAAVLAGCTSGFGGTPSGSPLEFSVRTTDGKNLTHADYRGQVLVLDLMATWCGPCKGEMPHLKAFWEAHRGANVSLLSLDVDATGGDGDPLPDFKETYGGTWDFAYDTDDVFRRAGARGIPTLAIVDEAGVVRELLVDYPVTEDELAARVARVQAPGVP